MFYLTMHSFIHSFIHSVVRAFANGAMGHRIDPLDYFSFQPVLQDWCSKGRGMCYPFCAMVHIK